MQATGDRVATTAELTTGVQNGHDNLDGGLLFGGVLIDGNASPVVGNSYCAVLLNDDLDQVGVPCQGLIDGVVNDFVDQVVQAAFAG